MSEKCNICGEWKWRNSHKCGDRFEVIDEYNYDWSDPLIVYASDPEEAAEKACEKLDEDNQVEQDDVRILEVKSPSLVITKYSMRTSIDISYWATELEKEKELENE